MVSSKEIHEKLDAILSLPNWEEYQRTIEQLMQKLDELEWNIKYGKKDTSGRARRVNG